MLFPNNKKSVIYSDFSRNFIFGTYLLSLFSIFILTIFIYLVKTHVTVAKQAYLELITTITIIICTYVLFKTLCIKIIGYVSENDELKSKIYAIETTVLSIYGLISGFFLTLCFLNKNSSICVWLIIIFVILAALILIKILKIIVIFVDEKISPFFLILYLCAFEILPIWLIIDFL
jgi:hypothetical protein